MKRLIVMLVVLLVAGCNDKMTAWTMTGQDTDLKARLGTEVADGVEAGAVATWTPADDIAWGTEPTGAGAYVILEASWEVQNEDTSPDAPVPVAWLEQLHAVPYVGIEWVDQIENDNFSNLQPTYLFGTKFLFDDTGNVGLAVEYSDGDAGEPDTFIGGFLKF